MDFLTNNASSKTLVICGDKEQAIMLDGHLKLTQGINSAAFHEGLSLIERDRAAAYFSDVDGGAQTLICSEIGSEGRNFQFAANLVLFDLPTNPDLLEQRIGRLDRIGRDKVIAIHVPYIIDTPQEGLFHWYHTGLNAFEQSCAAGYAVSDSYGWLARRYVGVFRHRFCVGSLFYLCRSAG